jgi:uncharacterized repeat protein (TIGR02543 family)
MPFPQGQTFTGCLKPSKGQPAMNTDVLNFYNNNYKQYIVGPSSDGQYYIAQTMTGVQDDNGATYSSITTSEAHGYGMIIIALMSGANGETNGKAIFDGMLKFAQNHPSSVNSTLMNWAPSAVSGTLRPSNCASDGDLDIAYACILADKQWGSAGTYNYLNIAKTRLAAIRTSIFDGTTHRITIDDNTDPNDYNTRSSDWILDHVHTFASVDATYKTTYDAVAAEVFNCINGVANTTTGLVPDFVTGSSPVADPNAAGTGESNGQYYSYNGCRYPWRIAMDYMHFGTAAAKTAASKLANWAITATGNNLAELESGYQLNGTALVDYGQEREFVAPMVVAATTTTNQSMVDDGWAAITGSRTIISEGTGVYSNGIDMACLLAISGNWWNPVTSTPADTNTVFLYLIPSGNNGTITNPAGTTTFNKSQNTSVTLTAVPNAGFVFVNWTGSVTGTNPTISVVMNANKTITANFASTSPNLVPFMAWEANIDALGSTVVIDSSKIRTTGAIGAVMTTVKNANYDSYSSLEGYLDTVLTGATKISITYTSSKAFWFSLDQAGTDGFGIDLPAATTSSTIDISISGTTIDVKRPSWSTVTTALNLSLVSGLSFDPATDADDAATAAITGTINVTSLKIAGYIGNAFTKISVRNMIPKAFAPAVSVRAGQLRLSVPKEGNYKVALYGINGRLAREVSCRCAAGENRINVRGMARGEYIVRMTGAVAFNGKIIIGR